MSRISSKLSITGTSHQSWLRCPKTTPMSRAWRIRSFQGTRPSTAQEPLSGVSTPQRTLMVVLFPAPLGPMYPTISPSPMLNESPSSARTVS